MNVKNDIKDLPRDVQVKAGALIMRPVRMVVIYKPTNEAAMKEIPLSNCRHFFEKAVASMREKYPEALDTDFVAVQIDWKDQTVITSSL